MPHGHVDRFVLGTVAAIVATGLVATCVGDDHQAEGELSPCHHRNHRQPKAGELGDGCHWHATGKRHWSRRMEHRFSAYGTTRGPRICRTRAIKPAVRTDWRGPMVRRPKPLKVIMGHRNVVEQEASAIALASETQQG